MRHRPATLRELLRSRTVRTWMKCAALVTTRTLRLMEALRASCLIPITVAIARRVYRTTLSIALRLFTTPAISVALSFHLRTAKSLITRMIVTPLIISTRRIYRTTIAIALRLFATRAITFALSFHLRTALWLSRVFSSRRVVLAACSFRCLLTARLLTLRRCIVMATSFGGGRCVRSRGFGGRLVRRYGFLGLQWSDAEGNSTAEPGEWVGSGFHKSMV